MRPLKVALFSDSFLPVLNGVSISIKALVDELRRQGHSVHVFTAAYFRHQDSDPNIVRFPALHTPWAKGYPFAFPPFYPMLRHFRAHEFDVIHTHTPFTIGFVGLRWAESHGIPIVTTYHTLYDKYAHYVPYSPKRYTRYKIAKHTNFYYNQVDQVITPSEASLRWLQRHSVRKPITVIPTSTLVRRPLNGGELRLAKGIPLDRQVLLYVGRIAREKNLETLLAAFAYIAQAKPDTLLVVVGDGPYRKECTEMARSLGIGDRVRFEGFVPRELVDEYYALADLFLFASTTETQGLVVTEAMNYGLPAVVVQGGGAGAAVIPGQNGFLVRNDARDLADAALSVLGNTDLLDSLSRAAVESVRSYTVEDMTRAVLGVYGRAMGMESGEPDPADFAVR